MGRGGNREKTRHYLGIEEAKGLAMQKTLSHSEEFSYLKCQWSPIMKHWGKKKYQPEAIVVNQVPSDEALNFEGGLEKRHQIHRKTLCQDNTVTNCE